MPPSENLTISIFLLLLLVLGGGSSLMLKKLQIKRRLLKLSARSTLGVDAIVDSIIESTHSIDRVEVKRELIRLATDMSVPVGLLRADDVVEDLIGRDFFAGDAVLEIEKQLQKTSVENLKKLTVQQVVIALTSNTAR